MRYIENSQVTHVTAFYGVLNVNTFEFHYCRAGHPNTLLQRNDDDIIELESEGSFLGMFDQIQFDRPPLLPVLIAIAYKFFGVGHFSAHLPTLIS